MTLPGALKLHAGHCTILLGVRLRGSKHLILSKSDRIFFILPSKFPVRFSPRSNSALLFEGKTQGVRPNKQYDCFKKNMLKSTVCHLRSRNHLGNINRVSPSHDWKYPGEMISGDWIRKWCMLLIPPKMPKRKSSLILERDFTYFGDCMGVHVLNTNWCCLFKVITILFYEKQVLLKNPENLN